MEVAISALTSDLISRFISFVIRKYQNQASLEEKLERLKHLVLRAHTIVEEADSRLITNFGMLVQLKMIAERMYRGYYVLDTFTYSAFEEINNEEEVSSSSALSSTSPITRFRTNIDSRKSTANNHDLERAMESLETIVASMTEFVIILGGCERMLRRPYDTYLYIDNFMFGRHAEKQQVINILLQSNPLVGPSILPIIGGRRVGKKTLVGHVCNDNRVRSHFSSILHINSDSILSTNHEMFMCERTLFVIEFVSDMDDEHLLKFNSLVTSMDKRSVVIIISRFERLARFGTVKPIHLKNLSHVEYNYLFKVLAFGSTSPEDHPKLVSIAKEIAKMLGGSLITANVLADILRKTQNVALWLHVLRRFKGMVDSNILMSGEHPKIALENDRPIDITKLVSSSAARIRLLPPHTTRDDAVKRKIPRVMFGDLIVGSAVLPKGEFELLGWKSRIPPYTICVATCVEEKPRHTTSARKRQRLY